MFQKILHHAKTLPIALLALAIVASLLISPLASSPDFHKGTLEIIQHNKTEATAITSLVTVASVAITALPDDTASSLANELADLTTPLLLVVCVLYFEQFLLTSLEYIVFSFLVPAGLALLIANVWTERRSFSILATKVLLIALICAIIIPLSAAFTGMIEATFSASIDSTFSQVDQIKEAFSGLTGNEDGASILSFFSSLASGVASILSYIMNMLSLLVDAVAILMITSVVMPVITALMFVWCIKSIIAGKMENLHDTALDVMKRIPQRKHPRIEKPKQAA